MKIFSFLALLVTPTFTVQLKEGLLSKTASLVDSKSEASYYHYDQFGNYHFHADPLTIQEVRWSQATTWENGVFPVNGDSLWIPEGTKLIFDVDQSPILNEVVIEGSLVFDPQLSCLTVPRTFDAHYIFIRGGTMEAGTEGSPYDCKLTITLHGNKFDPEIPLYGNKVLGLRYGILDLHGKSRTQVWVDLSQTALVSATSITVTGPVDWEAGDEIVIASTSYDMNEAETRTITSVDNTNPNLPVIHFVDPLLFQHYAASESYTGGVMAEMRAEVGLLNRNIVFQGDASSSSDENGAIISIISCGANNAIARIEHVEFRQVGQASKELRNPIMVQTADSMSDSYFRSNSIHNSFNRGISLHSVQDLHVEYNVLYSIKGHSIALDDGQEKNNIIAENLVVKTLLQWSNQNTEQTPASFWIRSPENVFIGNRAAGSEGFGFWINLPDHPVGGLVDPTQCPSGKPLIQFNHNSAHSNGRTGLYQSGVMNPKQAECEPLENTVSVTATMNTFTAWKNIENGVFMESIGDVRMENFLAADNLFANLEVAQTPHTPDGTAQFINAVMIGHSGNADATTLASSVIGFVAPRSDNFQVNGARFYNHDLNNMVPIRGCSQCNLGRGFTDSGARTVTTSQLFFEGYNRLLSYVFPFRDIYFDLDGTLTGQGPNSWATRFWPHNRQPECLVSAPNTSVFCDNRVQVRRIALWNYSPLSITNAEVEALKWDDFYNANQPNIDFDEFETDQSQYSILSWKTFADPDQGWALPFVTGHSYKLHWRQGIDFNRIQLDISEKWTTNDNDLIIIFNHTATREQWQVEVSNLEPKVILPQDTLPNSPLISLPLPITFSSGDNVHLQNERMFKVLINGRDQTRRTLTLRNWECLDNCPSVPRNDGLGGDDEQACPGIRHWSVASDWDSGFVPVAAEHVIIRRNCIFIFDVQNTPVLESLTVYGTLKWQNNDPGLSLTLNTKIVYNRGGNIKIGKHNKPFIGQLAQIQLYGTKFTKSEPLAPEVEAGNKMIGNTGYLGMFGEHRHRFTRLRQLANEGSLSIRVGAGLGWRAGDQIAILTSNNDWKASEDVFISNYNDATGDIVLQTALLHTHWGAENPTTQYQDVDVRAEVLLLTSNVKVTAVDGGTNWGCQIVTSDTIDRHQRVGAQFEADNIETRNCSQFDSFKAAIRFDQAKKKDSYVRNSAFHHGLGYGLQISNSKKVEISNCIFYDFIQYGGNVDTSSKITLSGNIFAHIGFYQNNFNFIKPNGALLVCVFLENDVCSKITLDGNTVVGSFYTGFGVVAHDCNSGATGLTFTNNIAHSVNGEGAIFVLDTNSNSQGQCLEARSLRAYKNLRHGAIVVAPTEEIRVSDMILVDNGFGSGVFVGKEGNELKVKMNNVHYFGETEHKDCAVEDECLQSTCTEKVAFRLPLILQTYNPPFPRNESLPDLVEYDASWGGSIELQDVSFNDFPSNKQFCGGRISLFEPHADAADYTPEVIFANAQFHGVNEAALGFFHNPNAGWSVVEQCGEFECTGLENMIVTFNCLQTFDQGTTTFGLSSATPLSLVSNNPNLNAFFTSHLGCNILTELNGHICYTDALGHLLFESLDSDALSRTFSPISIESPDLPLYSNILNSFRDKRSAIQFGQQRNSRFAFTVLAPQNTHYMYSLTYTGTVPEYQRFTLRDTSSGVIVQIKYTEQNSYQIRNEKTGLIVPYNNFDPTLGVQEPINKFVHCGENRYLGIVNVLEFYITPGCTLFIEPRNVVLGSLRLDWSLTQFYSQCGTETFVERLSEVLGIDYSSVVVAGVSAGSVIVDFSVSGQEEDGEIIREKLEESLGRNTTMFGAPILDFNVKVPGKMAKPSNEGIRNEDNIGGQLSNLFMLMILGGFVVLLLIVRELNHAKKQKQ